MSQIGNTAVTADGEDLAVCRVDKASRCVILDFLGRGVSWVALEPEQARLFATRLLAAVKETEGLPEPFMDCIECGSACNQVAVIADQAEVWPLPQPVYSCFAARCSLRYVRFVPTTEELQRNILLKRPAPFCSDCGRQCTEIGRTRSNGQAVFKCVGPHTACFVSPVPFVMKVSGKRELERDYEPSTLS